VSVLEQERDISMLRNTASARIIQDLQRELADVDVALRAVNSIIDCHREEIGLLHNIDEERRNHMRTLMSQLSSSQEQMKLDFQRVLELHHQSRHPESSNKVGGLSADTLAKLEQEKASLQTAKDRSEFKLAQTVQELTQLLKDSEALRHNHSEAVAAQVQTARMLLDERQRSEALGLEFQQMVEVLRSLSNEKHALVEAVRIFFNIHFLIYFYFFGVIFVVILFCVM
jgi:hypothetical protein